MRTFLFLAVWCQLLVLSFLAPVSHGQDHPMDLRELSLNELLAVDLVEVTAGDTNVFFEGQWSVGYRYQFQQMRDYLVDDDELSVDDLLHQGPFPENENGMPLVKQANGYLISPGDMQQEVHSIEGIYSPTERLRVLAAIPFIRQQTDHVRTGPSRGAQQWGLPTIGEEFTIKTSGLSDINLKLAYTAVKKPSYQFLVFGGVYAPTGSIDETGDVPAGRDRTLPYTMQLGSGTWDLEPGIAYHGRSTHWNWGAEIMTKVRLGRNDAGYAHGDRRSATLFLTHRTTDWFAPSFIATGRCWDDISGRDRRLDALQFSAPRTPRVPEVGSIRYAVPVTDPSLYGGYRVDLSLRLNFAVPRGLLKGNRVAIEAGFPAYQDLNGPQVQAVYRVGVSWQWAF